jgi:hypothetical protein
MMQLPRYSPAAPAATASTPCLSFRTARVTCCRSDGLCVDGYVALAARPGTLPVVEHLEFLDLN